MASQKIVELWRKTGSNVFSLVGNNHSTGLIVFQSDDSAIDISACMAYNSPIHNLSAFPAHVLYSKIFNAWYNVEAINRQTLRAYSYREQLNEKLVRVITEFTWPEKYEGLRFKKRHLYFKLKQKKLVLFRIVTVYDDDRRNTGDFVYHRRKHSSLLGSAVEITWKCQVEPAQSTEIFFPSKSSFCSQSNMWR